MSGRSQLKIVNQVTKTGRIDCEEIQVDTLTYGPGAYIEVSGSDLTFTDSVVGTRTLTELLNGGTYSHQDLINLQGGNGSTEYYHLTNSDHTELTTWLGTVILAGSGSINLSGTGTLFTDTISESTGGSGITAESVVLKSGNVEASSVTISGSTINLLMSTDGSKNLTSVSNLTSWIAGTTNRISVNDDGDGTVTITAPQDIHSGATPEFSQIVISSATPIADNHAVRKDYVDNYVAGIQWKASCKAGTTAELDLSGPETIDNVSITDGDRVLVKDQTTNPEDNGIYICNGSGAWTRPSDADASSELICAVTVVEEGDTYADTEFVCTVDEGFILGTDPVTWIRRSKTSSHNDLSNLNGDADYYHLSASDHSELTSWVSTATLSANGSVNLSGTGTLYVDIITESDGASGVAVSGVTVDDEGTVKVFNIPAGNTYEFRINGDKVFEILAS